MTRSSPCWILPALFLGTSALSLSAQEVVPAVPAPVAKIFKANCLDCHSGASPSAGLHLDAGRLPASILDKPSMENPNLKIADSAAPAKSYLLMKVRGGEGISGSRMPLRSRKLSEADIQVLAEWLSGLKPPVPGPVETKKKLEKPAFWGVTLACLPTAETVEEGRFLFRIAHRFYPAVRSGADELFGLDGPASTMLAVSYGLSGRLSISLAAANQDKEFDLAVHYAVVSGEAASPMALTLHAGASLATDPSTGRSAFDDRNLMFHAQASFSFRLTDRLSLLAVPAYVTNADYRSGDRLGTLALGLGGRWMFLGDISLLAEWVPVLSGYRAAADGWAAGIEKKIGGHVFQFMVLNTSGALPGQYLPGGDLLVHKGESRFAFNIYRAF
jgi:hypothetical protein